MSAELQTTGQANEQASQNISFLQLGRFRILSEMQSFFYFGMLTGLFWSTWTVFSTSAEFCTCRNLSSCEERCNSSAGVHNLSCFGERSTEAIIKYYCRWNPGQYDKYHLFKQQRRCELISGLNFIKNTISPPFPLKSEALVTVFALALSDDQKRCAIAKFSGNPLKIIHCGPPVSVTLRRRHGHLNVMAEWTDSNVKHYNLQYRKHNTTVWNEVKSLNSRECDVGDLVSSQSYEMQIQCIATDECPQCSLSNVIWVPQELKDAPVIEKKQSDVVQTGQRKITVKWKYVLSHTVEHYIVTVQKVSGEPAETSSYSVKAQTVTLFLSYSAYKLDISAVNRAGSSPAAHLVIDAMKDQSDFDGTFSVTLKSNNSFSLSWNNTLSRKYPCYSVEWWASNEKLSYETFYVKKNYHTVQTQNVTFQPYKRYHFLLHARHEKDTCNLKNVNESDQTYGRTQVYLTEGTPLTAPGRIRSSNVTQNSFVITWSPVPEQAVRGFLQGYIIHYTQDSSKKNITVHPSMHSYDLLNLQSGSIYCVQLSAYTAAGEGKRSKPMCLDTLDSVAIAGMLAGVIAGAVALLLATHLCLRLLKRSKKLLWPSIPNPYNSNAVQKMESGQELEVMELLRGPNLEETEEHVSVLEVKKEARSACKVSPDWTKNTLMPKTAPLPEDNEPSLSPTTSRKDSTPHEALPIDRTHDASIEDSLTGANNIKDASCALVPQSVSTAVANPTSTFMSDYTTMELFQQITKAAPPPSSSSGAASSGQGQEHGQQSPCLSENTRSS